jgi:hypothetical protein
MKKFRLSLVIAGVFSGMLLAAVAGAAQNGVLGCRGQSALLSGGTSGNQVYTIYQLSNFNDTATISIDRMIVYGEEGSVICDFPGVDAFPARLHPVLGPHNSTSIATLNMPCMPPAAFPGIDLSVAIYWSYVDKVGKMPLDGTAIEQVLDVATYSHLGRSSHECRELNLK